MEKDGIIMDIYDINDNIVDNPDLKKGYVRIDNKIIHHNAVRGKPAEYEWGEKKLSNGSISRYPIKKISDEVIGKDAYDEEVQISRYVEYTEEELNEINNKKILSDYIKWFDTYFSMQLQQHSWQDDYKPSYDNYFDCNYNNWEEVCIAANEIRKKIKILSKNINKANI